jgi:hypothetical protein
VLPLLLDDESESVLFDDDDSVVFDDDESVLFDDETVLFDDASVLFERPRVYTRQPGYEVETLGSPHFLRVCSSTLRYWQMSLLRTG